MSSKVKDIFYLPGAGVGSDEGSLGFNELGVSVRDDEEVQGMDDGDSRTAKEAYLLPLSCTLEKMAKTVSFRL